MRKRIKARKPLLALFGAWAFFASMSCEALAQCAMCRATVQASASTNAAAASNAFNLAVLVLLVPPVLIFCAFFIALLRYRKSMGDGRGETLGSAGGL